jgi:hypothetical protein
MRTIPIERFWQGTLAGWHVRWNRASAIEQSHFFHVVDQVAGECVSSLLAGKMHVVVRAVLPLLGHLVLLPFYAH